MDSDVTTVKQVTTLPDNGTWSKNPFIVELTGNNVKDFNTFKEVLEYATERVDAAGTSGTKQNGLSALLEDGNKDVSPFPFSSDLFFSDTRLGWNDAINSHWQFNRDDDIVYPIYYSQPKGKSGYGLGRVYARTLQAHQQILWLSFGVPHFSGMLRYFTNSVTDEVAQAMRNGGSSNLLPQLAGAAAFGLVGAIKLPFMPFVWFANLRKNYQVSKYYDFRSAMPQYFSFANTILGQLAVNLGLISGFTPSGNPSSATSSDALPLFMQKHGMDVWNILSQRAKLRTTVMTGDLAKVTSTYDLLAKMTPTVDHLKKEEAAVAEAPANDIFTGMADSVKGFIDSIATDVSDMSETFMTGFSGTAYGALSFVGFRIEKSTDSSESFSNSTGESSLAQKMNRVSQEGNDRYNSSSGYQTGISVVDEMRKVVTSFMSSLGASLSFGTLINTYAGSAYLDIPEVWQSSSFGKSYSVKFNLRAMYGDTITIMQDLYFPLALILAGTLPRGTGINSYTSPFVCRGYCKGMFAFPLGMIESLNIRRGGSEFGWNVNNLPTSIDVDITFKDLSPAMYLAMDSGGGIKEFMSILGQNSSFQEYLMTLSGLGVSERVRFMNNIERRYEIWCQNFRNSYANPLWWGGTMGDNAMTRHITNFSPFTGIPNN